MDPAKNQQVKPTSGSVNKQEYIDQRVRGHDFIAYFRSHLMTICLVFWFLTISVSVGATAIYLIKKLEMDSKKNPSEATTEKNGAPERADLESEKNDLGVDVVDFLIDTFYPETEEKSEQRAEEALLNATSTNFTVLESEMYDGEYEEK